MFLQALPETTQAVDINFLTDMVVNPIINKLGDGLTRIQPSLTVGIGVLLTIVIADFGYSTIAGTEHFGSGLRRLLGLCVWLYIIRDFASHTNALMNTLVSVVLVFGDGGGDWRQTLDPSRIAGKGFELGAVLLDNLPPILSMDLSDILGVGIGYLLILGCFAALTVNVAVLVLGFYMALPVAAFFSVFGLLPQTRGFAMRGITAMVSYGVHFMLTALALTLSEDVIRGLRFSAEPTMHEIWSMVFIVLLLTVFGWWGPQRVAASFMSGSVGIGGAEAVALGASVGTSVVAAATGAAGAAVYGMDKVVKGLDNRPTDGGRGGGGGAGGAPGNAPPVSQSIQPAPAAPPMTNGGAIQMALPPGGATATPVTSNATSFAPSATNAPILTKRAPS